VPGVIRRLTLDVDPFANDPGHWGASLVNNAELIVPVLDAAGVRSIVEVGAYAGDLTRLLLLWGAGTGARVFAIDPMPQPELVALDEQHEELELVRATSLEGLQRIPAVDAVVLDGDHNYYTVAEELRIVAERAADDGMPLILLHDVCWPHARRDDYYAPDQIPEEARQPVVEGGGVFPGEPGVRPGGLPYRWPAAREGGPRNGVLTAVEDFVERRPELRLAVVPAFFGLGVVWDTDAPWAADLAALLDPWDRNPLLERLEANRALHLASSHWQLREAAGWQQRAERYEQFLSRLLMSRTFALAERLSALRGRGRPEFSKDEIRRLLARDG
jgi:methyltransferase family protein